MKRLLTPLLLALCCPMSASAVNIQDLIQETQRLNQEANTMTLVWWVPSAFWEESMRSNRSLSDEQVADFVAILDEYSTFIVIRAKIGVMGSFTFADRDELADNLKFVVGDAELAPLAMADLNGDARNFFTVMKPMMTQMLGQMGEGMEFFVYPNRIAGEVLLDPRQEGHFAFTAYENEFDWRLPLGSLLPPATDPATGETFPGNYRYNPFTGSKLDHP